MAITGCNKQKAFDWYSSSGLTGEDFPKEEIDFVTLRKPKTEILTHGLIMFKENAHFGHDTITENGIQFNGKELVLPNHTGMVYFITENFQFVNTGVRIDELYDDEQRSFQEFKAWSKRIVPLIRVLKEDWRDN